MENEFVDVDLVKKWYLKAYSEFQDVDAAYKDLERKRSELVSRVNLLRPILQKAAVNVDEIEKGLRRTSETEDKGIETKTLPNLIHETLQAAGHPMHYSDVLNALTSKGHVVGGRDPRNTLLAYLNRYKKQFAKAPEAGRGYYKLKE
jgi:hypothetical protein